MKKREDKIKTLVQQTVLWLGALVLVCIVAINTYNGNVEELKEEVTEQTENPKWITTGQREDYLEYLTDLLQDSAAIEEITVDFNQRTNNFKDKSTREIITDASISQTVYIAIKADAGTNMNDLEDAEWIAKRKEQEVTADKIKEILCSNNCHGYYLIEFPDSDAITYSL